MSFGFGSGDVASFVAFGKKVVDALQEEDGSSAQYRVVKKQCDAFVDDMHTAQRLDLSHLLEHFRNQIKVSSRNVEEHVGDFEKDTIDRFDKSMAEHTKRNKVSSAPRRVQWAFGAAEQLANFHATLNNWLQMIQVLIQAMIL